MSDVRISRAQPVDDLTLTPEQQAFEATWLEYLISRAPSWTYTRAPEPWDYAVVVSPVLGTGDLGRRTWLVVGDLPPLEPSKAAAL